MEDEQVVWLVIRGINCTLQNYGTNWILLIRVIFKFIIKSGQQTDLFFPQKKKQFNVIPLTSAGKFNLQQHQY